MLILFNKYINTIIYTFIYISLLYCLLLCSSPSGVWIPDGWWCLPGGWWCIPGGWWCILTSSAAYCSRAPRQGHALTPQCGGARRRNPSFKGIKMKGYCSIYQLFKLSSWVALYKSFMD